MEHRIFPHAVARRASFSLPERKLWVRYWPSITLVAAAVMIFAVYTATLAPTITWRNGGADSGELAAAVASLGIAHPPGYPAYILLGHLWSMLPLGHDLAFRLNLLSAVCAATAGWLAMRLLLALSAANSVPMFARVGGAIWAGGILLLSPLVWSQATITEVYAPGLLPLVLVTYLLLRKKRLSTGEIGAAGLAVGVGAGILPQTVLVLPAAVLLLWVRHWHLPYGWPRFYAVTGRWAVLFSGFLLGTGVFLFIPLRAMAYPAANWGVAVTFTRFWALITAQQYHHLLLEPASAAWVIRLADGALLLVRQIGGAGLVLALWGGYRLWQKARPAAIFLLTLGLGTMLFQAGYPVDGNAVYLLPAIFVAAVFSGWGLVDGLTFVRRKANMPAVQIVAGIMLLSMIWRGVLLFPQVDVSTDWQAYTFGQQVLAGLPSDAVVITDRDETTFSLWYMQSQNVRRDVTVIDNRLLFYDWYVQHLRQHAPTLQGANLEPGAVAVAGRPVFLLTTSADFSADSFKYLLRSKSQ